VTVWETRDLPVLRALTTSDDENLRHGVLHLRSTPSPLGVDLSPSEMHDALADLWDAGYIECTVQYESGPIAGALFNGLRVTGRGQQALGQWPLFDEIASPATLALFLERLADQAPTTEEASNLRRAAAYARKLSAASLRAAAVGALAHVVRNALGLP
jgi:hypothetical protein